MKLSSLLVMLLVLGAIYARARDPQTWRWLAQDDSADLAGNEAPAERTEEKPAPRPPTRAKREEAIVAGPTELDPAEQEAAAAQFAAVSDKAPLTHSEMPAYWRLMRWARAQSFDDLSRRARRDVPFAQLFEQPEKYRGRPLRLRLHVKRILEYEAPQNSAGVERVYEAWGWTDESKSYPYVVLFTELPAGMRVGADVSEEGVFVGYFLKTMSYVAFEKSRAAPLVLGRFRDIERSAPPAPRWATNGVLWVAGGVVAALTALFVWLTRRRPRRAAAAAAGAPLEESDLAAWLVSEQSPNP